MTTLRTLLLIALGVCACAFAADPAPSAPPGVVMRKPFTLTLHIDKEHYFEQNMNAIPYVHEDGVYLMKGDEFGISLDMSGGSIKHVTYQPDLEKADMTFEFRQDVSAEPNGMMLLTIRNRTSKRLMMKALMTVPGHKNAAETSLLPVEPGLTNFESWPHPIVQLYLHDFSASGDR